MKIGALLIVAALAACGGGTTTNGDGTLNGKCFPNNTCNAGLACVSGTCEMGLDIDAAVLHDAMVDGFLGHPDSSTLPDAFVPDSSVLPDAFIPDGGVMTDGSVTPDGTVMTDGSVTPDGTVMTDAGSMTCDVLAQAGCTASQKCTWILDTDPTSTTSGLGHIGCAPSGAVATNGACTILPAAQGGYDNCIKADACVSGLCKSICNNAGGTPACGANQACVTYDGLFANSGATTIPAGVCDPSCNPLDDNDFDGAGAVHTKIGTACTTDPTEGCYGFPSTTNTTFFTCAHPATGTGNLTHRSVLAASQQFLNSCMSGYTIAFAHDATGSNNVDCYAFCKPGDAYMGNAGVQAPNGVAPHRCSNNDALGAFGTVPNGTAASNGEHCVYSWFFEVDTAGMLHISPTSNTVGICWDHSKYQYDSNGDGTPDTIIPPCAALPLTSATGALTAVDVSCVSTTTAGLSFTGKPRPLHRPFIENLPEFPALQKK